MIRDEKLLQIRPQVHTEENYEISNSEAFQNNTLRPILKLQNELLVFLFKSSNAFIKSKFAIKPVFDQKKIIEDTLKKDTKLKNQVESCIMAMMTDSELKIYFENRPEQKRRINTMTIARLKDQLTG